MRLSYSAISKYQQCPRQFQHLYVLRNVQQEQTEAATTGTQIHEALETALRDKTPLPAKYADFAPYLGLLSNWPGRVHPEVALAADQYMRPCAYEQGYIVGKLDVLALHGDKALVLDWKTGKPRDNALQMQIYAWLTMLHYPEVQSVTTRPIYLYHPTKKDPSLTFPRDNMTTLRHTIEGECIKIELAQERGAWPARPSALCGWCSVKTCQHHPEHKAW